MAQINAAKVIPLFEKRFAGLKINHVDATADKLAARAITEARGGKVSADIFQMTLENILQLADQKLVIEKLPPEAAVYPDNLKGSFWIAADLLFITGAWNTNLVKKGEEPKQFEDFADPRWKGRLIAEPRDVEILMGLANHKYKSDEKAIALLKKIAVNNVEFHKGHSQLAEFLVAGQAAACFTCYAHHYPPRIKKGAPLGYMLTEGVASINATAVAKDSPASQYGMVVCPLVRQRGRAKGLRHRRPHAAPSQSRAHGQDPAGENLSNRHRRTKELEQIRKDLERYI